MPSLSSINIPFAKEPMLPLHSSHRNVLWNLPVELLSVLFSSAADDL